MTITLIGCAITLLFALLGYRRGILRILSFFVALLAAGLLASPLSRFTLPLFDGSHIVPRALAPLAALLGAGLAVFILATVLIGWVLGRRERGREAQNLPPTEPWERLSGALLGGLWGTTLVVLVLAGLHLIGNVEQALAQSINPPPPTPPATMPGRSATAPVSSPAAPSASSVTATKYGALKEQIDASAFAPLVRSVNPAEEKIAHIFGDLALVTGDEVLLDRFQRHPSIARLTAHPALLEVAQDNTIRILVEEHRYYELLDHPKIAALLKNQPLVAECRKVDLEAVLAEVLGRTPAHAPKP